MALYGALPVHALKIYLLASSAAIHSLSLIHILLITADKQKEMAFSLFDAAVGGVYSLYAAYASGFEAMTYGSQMCIRDRYQTDHLSVPVLHAVPSDLQ